MSLPVRKIIQIDEEKCDGCGLCIPSCAEGALQIVDGKARLIKDILCDGLGNCLGECPQGAIEMTERKAEPFDETAVEEHLRTLQPAAEPVPGCAGACAGSAERSLGKRSEPKPAAVEVGETDPEAELSHWPIQLHLVSPQARFLQGRDLLIAADCVPFAYADFHRKLLAGKSLVIGCPKLDDAGVYLEKLVQIFSQNRVKSVTLAHMEVPCCFGMSRLVRSALEKAGQDIDVTEVVIGVDGAVKNEA